MTFILKKPNFGLCCRPGHLCFTNTPILYSFLEFPDDAANSSQDDSELECTETEEESQEGSEEEEEESPKKGGKSKKT